MVNFNTYQTSNRPLDPEEAYEEKIAGQEEAEGNAKSEPDVGGALGGALSAVPGLISSYSAPGTGNRAGTLAKAGGTALAGAKIGSSLGSVVPGAGNIIGGAVGGVLGAIAGFSKGRQEEKAKRKKENEDYLDDLESRSTERERLYENQQRENAIQNLIMMNEKQLGYV